MNLEDVAARAGVSTATVSRVVNNIGVVRGATRERVLNAIEELNYTPNVHAQALAGGKSRTLGLIVSNLENPFFLDIYRSLETAALRSGHEVLVASTDYDRERLGSAVRNMIGRRLAGLGLIVSEIEPQVLDELAERKLRTVVLDSGPARKNITCIRTNYKRGMQRMAEYLYSLGHRRLAFIGHHEGLASLHDRAETFAEVMKHYGRAVQTRQETGADGYEGGYAAVMRLLDTGFRPTALVCVNDCMAVGALRALHERGLRVPQDVSLAGFDNISLAEYLQPALTTVHIARDVIGSLIHEHLTSGEDRRVAREIVIEPELVIRQSTGPAQKPAAQKA